MINAKPELRQHLRQTLQGVTIEQRQQWSQQVARRLFDLPEVRKADKFLLFAPLPEEIDTQPIFLQLREMNKQVAFPFVGPQQVDMHCMWVEAWEELMPNSLGFPEPPFDQEKEAAPETLEIILTPGLAFDRRGHRLGRGKGHFDRFFASRAPQAFRIGLFYSVQEVDLLPVDIWDFPLDMILTDQEIIRIIHVHETAAG
ncbi:MAG: 5-formyltetrahydrofolate cyclo-ligase [Verrucomicrobiae bacterium]|nr:5-formyltetrahydrofolate cyclo-ligase [Verrucomicrobiae bacterium]